MSAAKLPSGTLECDNEEVLDNREDAQLRRSLLTAARCRNLSCKPYCYGVKSFDAESAQRNLIVPASKKQ
jgi:hypothetical protein